VSEASALEAVERIVNRGGEGGAVLDAACEALRRRGFDANAADGRLQVTGASDEFTARIATLLSHYLPRL
jgi:hypothetical protein